MLAILAPASVLHYKAIDLRSALPHRTILHCTKKLVAQIQQAIPIWHRIAFLRLTATDLGMYACGT